MRIDDEVIMCPHCDREYLLDSEQFRAIKKRGKCIPCIILDPFEPKIQMNPYEFGEEQEDEGETMTYKKWLEKHFNGKDSSEVRKIFKDAFACAGEYNYGWLRRNGENIYFHELEEAVEFLLKEN